MTFSFVVSIVPLFYADFRIHLFKHEQDTIIKDNNRDSIEDVQYKKMHCKVLPFSNDGIVFVQMARFKSRGKIFGNKSGNCLTLHADFDYNRD